MGMHGAHGPGMPLHNPGPDQAGFGRGMGPRVCCAETWRGRRRCFVKEIHLSANLLCGANVVYVLRIARGRKGARKKRTTHEWPRGRVSTGARPSPAWPKGISTSTRPYVCMCVMDVAGHCMTGHWHEIVGVVEHEGCRERWIQL